MAVHYRTQGFFIKKVDRGEADQLFTIYTKDYGKLEILGKAIRKIKSKLRGGAELFYLSEIEFIQGKTYKTLTDAVLINNFQNIKNDFEKLRISYKISKDLDSLIRGQESDEKIWQLLKEIFNKLSLLEIRSSAQDSGARQGWKLEILYYYFLWNLFSILGYSPELYVCCFCQKRIGAGKFYFYYKEGGVVCADCFERGLTSFRKLSGANPYFHLAGLDKIEPEVIKILRIIIKQDWLILNRLKIDNVFQKSLKNISQKYFDYICANLE